MSSERPVTDRLSLDLRLRLCLYVSSMFRVFIISLLLAHSPIQITNSRHVLLSARKGCCTGFNEIRIVLVAVDQAHGG